MKTLLRKWLGIQGMADFMTAMYGRIHDRIDKCALGTSVTALEARIEQLEETVRLMSKRTADIDPTSIQGRILAVYRANPAQQYHYKEAAAKAGLSTSDEHLNSLRATHTDLTRLGVIVRAGQGYYRAQVAA